MRQIGSSQCRQHGGSSSHLTFHISGKASVTNACNISMQRTMWSDSHQCMHQVAGSTSHPANDLEPRCCAAATQTFQAVLPLNTKAILQTRRESCTQLNLKPLNLCHHKHSLVLNHQINHRCHERGVECGPALRRHETQPLLCT